MENNNRKNSPRFNKEPFVEVLPKSGIDIKMQYPLLGMKWSESRCFVRKSVYERLLKAQSLLPEGYTLRIWDAWRPFKLQEELYYVYRKQIIEQFHLENASEEEQRAIITEYIALPNPDRTYPPTHTTGGAVDVTLLDAQGQELDMGTEFDSISPKAYAAYYEEDALEKNEAAVAEPVKVEQIRKNRRILRRAMLEAGFTGIASEWWHFNYGDRLWSDKTGKPAIYAGVYEISEMEICNECQKIRDKL